MRAIGYYRQNRSESLRYIAEELRLPDEALAAQMFDWHETVLADEGRPGAAWITGVLEFTRKSLELSAPLSAEQIFDFSFAEKARR